VAILDQISAKVISDPSEFIKNFSSDRKETAELSDENLMKKLSWFFDRG